MNLRRQIDLGDGVTEEAVTLPVDDITLRGNLIRVAGNRPGILFIQGFGGMRSGPHDLLTALARQTAKRGYSSLRFDLRGRGESTGRPEATTLADMASDALAAAHSLKSKIDSRKIVIVGICSGGNVGIGILDRLPEVAGLFLLSVYPFGDADSFQRDVNRSARHLQDYWRKLWLPETWRKLVRGEVQFGVISRVLMKPFRRRKPKTDPVSATPARHPLGNLLPRRLPVRMFYGDADPDFKPSFDYYQAFSTKHAYPLDLRVIPGANHNFYSLAWKYRLLDELTTYLEELK